MLVASEFELEPRVIRTDSWERQMAVRTDGCKAYGGTGMQKVGEGQEKKGIWENELGTSGTTWNLLWCLISSKPRIRGWHAGKCDALYHGNKWGDLEDAAGAVGLAVVLQKQDEPADPHNGEAAVAPNRMLTFHPQSWLLLHSYVPNLLEMPLGTKLVQNDPPKRVWG